ncbi:PH domain-containing protein [Salinibacillus xinjiangensis]|uniref:PH domain-containing protein n=1 Tax=Salinibacillus xinjiangensis TaxID=1229268 RepID=UPI001E582D5C|nr:PH domain-containing protein [Salinibacillus xinjiangensis]
MGFIFWGIILFIIFIYIFGSEPVGMQFITYDSVLGTIISGLIIGLLLWIWFGTGYRVERGVIKVRSGPFKSTIKIGEIKKLSKTKSPFSAPALSIDRLEILYGKYNIMNISPKNEYEFVQLLVTKNPRIQLDKKLSK